MELGRNNSPDRLIWKMRGASLGFALVELLVVILNG